MRKNSITNKITPCCGLPFSVIYFWISNIKLNSESDREFILSKISQGGVLSIDAWKVLINSGTLEADASLTKAEFLAWFDCERQPSCEQLKIIIESYKMGAWQPDIIFNANAKFIPEPITPEFEFEFGIVQIGFAQAGFYPNAGDLTISENHIGIIFFDGKNDFQKLEIELPIYQYLTENEEFIKAWIDEDENVVFGIRRDSTLYSPTFDFTKFKYFPDIIDDEEDRLEIVKDLEKKIIRTVEKDGTNYLPKLRTDNMKVEGIEFGDPALLQLSSALKNIGFGGGKGDQSDNSYIQLPIPKTIAYIDLDIEFEALPTAKPTEVDTVIQYWDKEGNYFKKPVTISVQGTSSAGHLRKNFTLDFDATIRFENWADRDSYYLKSFYTDAFRGQSIAMYRVFKEIIATRSIPNQKAFYSDYEAKSYWNGKGNLQTDMSSGANYVADGFPVALYCKGSFIGVFTIVQKKHRDNFDMKKSTAKHVWLDGVLAWDFFNGNIIWTDFEVRNPAIEKDINGNPYDGDFPTEIPASVTKNYIIALSNYVNQIDALGTTALKKTKFLQCFDLNGLMDYLLFSNLIVNFDGFAKNWQWYTKDGIKWSIGLHDLDNIFGQFWRGEIVVGEWVESMFFGLGAKDPTKYINSLFKDEADARYKELRDLGIFNEDYITEKMKNWLDQITYPMLKNDLAIWTETPSFRNSKTSANWVAYHMSDGHLVGVPLWNSSTNYAVGDKVKVVLTDDSYGFKALTANTNQNPVTGSYPNYPHHLGFYNSLDRVRKTVISRLQLMDSIYNY